MTDFNHRSADEPHDAGGGHVVNARDSLDQIQELAGHGHVATRWVAGFFAVLGVGACAVAVLMGLTGVTYLLPIMIGWAVLVAALGVWAARQRAALRGMGTLMGVWAVTFTVLWAGTIIMGERFFSDVLGWWVGAGAVLLLVHLALAALAWESSKGARG